MTDFTNLIDWYEIYIDDIDIDDFGDFTDSDIQSGLLDFGVEHSKTVDSGVAEARLKPAIGNAADDIFDVVKKSRKFISQVATKREFSFYNNLIDRNIQAPLAERSGIETARSILKGRRGLFTEEGDRALEFLKRHDPATAGGFIRQRQEIGRAFRSGGF